MGEWESTKCASVVLAVWYGPSRHPLIKQELGKGTVIRRVVMYYKLLGCKLDF